MPLALYPFLLFFFGILRKLFRFRSFKRKVLPHSLCLLVFLQHSPLSATMRLLFHCQFFNGAKPCAVKLSLFHCWHKLTVRTSTPSSNTIEANCLNLRALSLQRLSHQNMGLCGMLIALGTQFIYSASSRLRFNESLTQSCIPSDSTRITFLFGL